MKENKRVIIVALSTLVVGFLLGWFLFSGATDADENHQNMVEKAGDQVWTCSMHPQIRQNGPADCPICGMDLVPLENENDDGIDPQAISMSPTAMQLANVVTATVGEMEPVKKVRLNGKVQADERLISSQSSHIPGRIEKLMVNFTGEYVRSGQVIANIYSPELVTAQEELFEARKIKDSQPQLFRAAKEKLKNWKLSETQIERILTQGKAVESFPITADISGYVLDKGVNVGDYVKRGESIYEIANLSKVWVLFDVYESDMSWVNVGDKVSFTIQSLPGTKFEGKISFMDPVIDAKTRVAKARVEVANRNNRLKPEMFASGTVNARLEARNQSVVIPKSAVMWTGKRSVVYVKVSSDKGVYFKMRKVRLGPSLGESYIIESGLEVGEEIAINGTFSIDAAAQLAGKPSMMSPEGGVQMSVHTHGGTATTATKDENADPIVISPKGRAALEPLYANYLDLKKRLVADDLDGAKKAALVLKQALDKIDMPIFTGDAHNAWMKYSGALSKALNHVQHTGSIEQVRQMFQMLSATMIDLTKNFQAADQTLYIQFCPMADSNKGAYWLSTEEEIRNPYYGESMLSCGEVTATINPEK